MASLQQYKSKTTRGKEELLTKGKSTKKQPLLLKLKKISKITGNMGDLEDNFQEAVLTPALPKV